ncbi:hypothetical protein ANANG_G00095140 [Anguilla anguilla]|uniref:Fibrous sheath CABYR-binding protein-like n=1 Tax=Anguilla anguilla TaxID=7936 RepID=A0A9D3MFQ1_ANGAN|nr:hypothetical protein ANANG_G00095140 [Anguilla anguilla]
MDAAPRLGLFSILLLHICLPQVLVTAETPQVPESILPPTEVIAQEAEVTEVTLSAPAVEQEAAAQDEVEASEEVSQEVAAEPAEEAAPAVEEPAPEEEAQEEAQEVVAEVAVEAGEPAAEATAEVAGDAGEPAAAEPAQEEAQAAGEAGQEDPAVPDAAEEALGEVSQEAAVEEGVEDGTEAVGENAEEVAVEGNEEGAAQASETEEADLTPGPADTYVPAQSQDPAIPAVPAVARPAGGDQPRGRGDHPGRKVEEAVEAEEEAVEEVVEEEVEEEEVIEVEEEVIPATPAVPLLEELGEESELIEITAEEGTALGLEAWKIGAISAAVFLFLETVVIIVYFLKCRRKTASGAVPVKASEDCEAAQTANEEAEESSPAADEDQTQQNNISESLEMSQFQQEETMADIPLDPPAEPSPEEPANDVRTSVL